MFNHYLQENSITNFAQINDSELLIPSWWNGIYRSCINEVEKYNMKKESHVELVALLPGVERYVVCRNPLNIMLFDLETN